MISLKDKLSQITYRQACKLLGPQGETLIENLARSLAKMASAA